MPPVQLNLQRGEEMTIVMKQRAEPAMEVASPLIEMRGVEKVYRTGKLAALHGRARAARPSSPLPR